MCIGSETAKLLISTNVEVTESNLDGSNQMPISSQEEVIMSTRRSNGIAYMTLCVQFK